MINLVFAGHVDHGKSTLVGRIFYERGQIAERHLDRLKRHAAAIGKPNFFFAFFTDTKLDERERGISIEVAFRGLETDCRKFNIIDVPGHKDFIKNMISGTVEADAAVLVIDAKDTVSAGAAPQTREHLILLKALRIDDIIVAVNKMDMVGYDREAFEQSKLEIQCFCETILYHPGNSVAFVPISGLLGDNITRSSENMPWYEGPALLDLLNLLPQPAQLVDLPLRMPILRTFSVSGAGPVVAGKIETGQVKPGDSIVIVPYPGVGGMRAEVKSIEWQHKRALSASAGDDVGILLSKSEKGFLSRMVKKGAMVGSVEYPPQIAKKFRAEIMVVNHPSGIRAGYSPHIHVHQAAMPCTITEIVSAHDANGEEKRVTGENRLTNGDTAIVWITPHKPLVIESASKFSRLGSFVLRDGRTAIIGTCLEVEHI
jgi:elongation factor 1-alpha